MPAVHEPVSRYQMQPIEHHWQSEEFCDIRWINSKAYKNDSKALLQNRNAFGWMEKEVFNSSGKNSVADK